MKVMRVSLQTVAAWRVLWPSACVPSVPGCDAPGVVAWSSARALLRARVCQHYAEILQRVGHTGGRRLPAAQPNRRLGHRHRWGSQQETVVCTLHCFTVK